MFSGYRLALSLSPSPLPSPDKVSRCSLGNLELNHHVDQVDLKNHKDLSAGIKDMAPQAQPKFSFPFGPSLPQTL